MTRLVDKSTKQVYTSQMYNLFNKKKAVQKLIDTCELHLKDADVQPAYPDANGNKFYTVNGQNYPVTWCNRYADRIMKAMGYNMLPLYNKTTGRQTIDWSSPITMYTEGMKYADKTNSGVRKITMNKAVHFANHGVPIIAISREGVGHVAIVAPHEDKECWVYNAGSSQVMGLRSLNDAFIKWGSNPVFFQLDKV